MVSFNLATSYEYCVWKDENTFADLSGYLQLVYKSLIAKGKSDNYYLNFIKNNRYFISAKYLIPNHIFCLRFDNNIFNVYILKKYYDTEFLVYKIVTSEVNYNNLSDCNIKSICIYDSRNNKFYNYNEDNLETIINLLCSGPNIVTYNGDNFDKKIISKKFNKSLDYESYDLFQKIYDKTNTMYKLEDLIKTNFNKERINSKKILELSIQEAREFCKSDVKFIRDLYLLYQKSELKIPKLRFIY